MRGATHIHTHAYTHIHPHTYTHTHPAFHHTPPPPTHLEAHIMDGVLLEKMVVAATKQGLVRSIVHKGAWAGFTGADDDTE